VRDAVNARWLIGVYGFVSNTLYSLCLTGDSVTQSAPSHSLDERFIPRAWRVGLSDPDEPFITPGAEGLFVPTAWHVGLSDPDEPFITPGAEGLFVPTAAEGPCIPVPAVAVAAAAAPNGPFPTLAEDRAEGLYVPGTFVGRSDLYRVFIACTAAEESAIRIAYNAGCSLFDLDERFIPRAWRVGLSDPDESFFTPDAEVLAAAFVPTVTADVEAAVLTDSLPVGAYAALATLITNVWSLADQLRGRGSFTVDTCAALAAFVTKILSLAEQQRVRGDLTVDASATLAAWIQDLVSLDDQLRGHSGLDVAVAAELDVPTAYTPAAAEGLYVPNVVEELCVLDTAGGPVIPTAAGEIHISDTAPFLTVSPPSLDASVPAWSPPTPCPGAPQQTTSPPSFSAISDASAPVGAPYAPDPGTFLSTASPPSFGATTDASAPAGAQYAPAAGAATSLPSFSTTTDALAPAGAGAAPSVGAPSETVSSLSRGTATATSRAPRVRSTRPAATRRGPATKRYRRRCIGRAAACDTADLLTCRLACMTSHAGAGSLTSRAATSAPLRTLLRPGTSLGAAPTLL